MKLDRKQKILLTLIIIAVAYLLWQIYDMFFAGSAPVAIPLPTLSTASAPAATQTFQPVPATIPTQTTMPSMNTTAAVTTTTTAQPQPLTEVTLHAPLTNIQAQYLKLVDQYQLVKMQRLVADEQAAMVASKEKIAEANQQIAKISGGPVDNSQSMVGGEPTTTSPTGYQLMYIDYQDGHWTATLNKNGQFQEVNVGTTLDDGTRVLKIDQNGTIIRQDDKTYLLNFYGSTELANSAALDKPPVVRTPEDSYRLHGAPSLNPLVVARPQHRARTQKIHRTVKKIEKQTVMKVKPTLAKNGVISTTTTTTSVTNQKQAALDVPLTTTQAQALLAPEKTGLALSSQEKSAVLNIENATANTGAVLSNLNYTANEKYLLSLPASDYTLQVLGSYKLDDLNKLINANNLQGKAYIFHTYYLGKDWYVLVYGTYNSENQALQAINSMPKALQEAKPWVRQLSDVHAAINLNPQKPTN
jgi:septal ring-binding cell division protein DamX